MEISAIVISSRYFLVNFSLFLNNPKCFFEYAMVFHETEGRHS